MKIISICYLLIASTIALPPIISCDAYAQNLIYENNLSYLGAFRVPKGRYGASTRTASLASGGTGLTYNITKNSLYMVGHPYEKMIVELSIPTPVISTDLNALPTSSIVQGSIDPANGKWDQIGENYEFIANGVRPGGFLLFKDKIIGSAHAFYDGASRAARSHFTFSANWESAGLNFSGMFKVGTHVINPAAANGGFVGGYMANIPNEWQSRLGGKALTGQGALAVLTRSSLGPCAWAFDPEDISILDPAPAKMLVGYPSQHPTLGGGGEPSLYYNTTTELKGLVFPQGSDSVLFFGRHGLGSTGAGNSCYGYGSANPEDQLDNKSIADWLQANNNMPSEITDYNAISTWITNNNGTKYQCGAALMTASGGNNCCYDPSESAKGVHGYPYVYRVWAYDANQLERVNLGQLQPWDVVPYAIWNLTFPIEMEGKEISGAAYDPNTQRIFVVQRGADKYGLDPFPLIHVYQLNIGRPIRIIGISEIK